MYSKACLPRSQLSRTAFHQGRWVTRGPGCDGYAMARMSHHNRRQSSTVPAQPPLEDVMRQVNTLSQMYAIDRPAAIPVEQHRQRQRAKDLAEIEQAARKQGVDSIEVRARLASLETVLPGVVDLARMRAADWVTISSDIESATAKLVIIKTHFPCADALKIIASRPKLLLLSAKRIDDDVRKVRLMLAASSNAHVIIQFNPDFLDPVSLSRSLFFLASVFPGQDPVSLLQRDPTALHHVGESTTEADAEYGELSTKD